MSKFLGKWVVGLALVALFSLLTPGKASASGIYDITGSLSDGYGNTDTFVDSTITINSAGVATAASLDLVGSSPITFSGAPNAVDSSTEYEWIDYYFIAGDQLELTGNFASLGSSGTASATYSWFYFYFSDCYGGTITLTDAPAAPEPSTLLMLGLGLLGLFATTGFLSKSKLNAGLNQAA